MVIRGLTGDDVEVFRDVRLRALATDPDAFGTTYAEASALDEPTWRSRVEGFAGRPGRVFVAEDDDGVAGVVGIGESSDPSNCVLWGMWVDPTRRGSGIGVALLDAAVGWARERGAAAVTLWVMRANASAKRLYERHGFVERPYDGHDAPPVCADEPCLRLDL